MCGLDLDIRYNPSLLSPPATKTEPIESRSSGQGASNRGGQLDQTATTRSNVDQTQMYSVIAEHCLPKLVCELHAKGIEELQSFSESERTLVKLIG